MGVPIAQRRDTPEELGGRRRRPSDADSADELGRGSPRSASSRRKSPHNSSPQARNADLVLSLREQRASARLLKSAGGSASEEAGFFFDRKSLLDALDSKMVRDSAVFGSGATCGEFYHWLNHSRELRDMTEVEDDQAGELKEPMLVIHPESRLRASWDVLLSVLMLYFSLILPFRLGVLTEKEDANFAEDHPGVVIFGFFADVCFFVDIFMNFRTAYFDVVNQHWEWRTYKMALRYLRSTFLLDAIATVPVVAFFGLQRRFRLLRLLHIFRSVQASEKLSFLYGLLLRYIGKTDTFGRLLLWLMLMVLLTHWVACFFVLVGNPDSQDPTCADYDVPPNRCSWLEIALMFERGIDFRYFTAIHWAVQTLTTVGYGNVSINTIQEFIYQSFMMCLGVSWYAYAVSAAAAAIHVSDVKKEEVDSKMVIVNEFLGDSKLPSSLATSVRSHFRNVYAIQAEEDTRAVNYDRVKLIQELPPYLLHRVMATLAGPTLKALPQLRRLSDRALLQLVLLLQPHRAHEGEVIVREGTRGRDMYFLLSGKAHVTRHGHKIRTLHKGCFFGARACLPVDLAITVYEDNGGIVTRESTDDFGFETESEVPSSVPGGFGIPSTHPSLLSMNGVLRSPSVASLEDEAKVMEGEGEAPLPPAAQVPTPDLEDRRSLKVVTEGQTFTQRIKRPSQVEMDLGESDPDLATDASVRNARRESLERLRPSEAAEGASLGSTSGLRHLRKVASLNAGLNKELAGSIRSTHSAELLRSQVPRVSQMRNSKSLDPRAAARVEKHRRGHTRRHDTELASILDARNRRLREEARSQLVQAARRRDFMDFTLERVSKTDALQEAALKVLEDEDKDVPFKRNTSVVAVGSCELLRLDRNSMLKLIYLHDDFLRLLSEGTGARFAADYAALCKRLQPTLPDEIDEDPPGPGFFQRTPGSSRHGKFFKSIRNIGDGPARLDPSPSPNQKTPRGFAVEDTPDRRGSRRLLRAKLSSYSFSAFRRTRSSDSTETDPTIPSASGALQSSDATDGMTDSDTPLMPHLMAPIPAPIIARNALEVDSTADGGSLPAPEPAMSPGVGPPRDSPPALERQGSDEASDFGSGSLDGRSRPSSTRYSPIQTGRGPDNVTPFADSGKDDADADSFDGALEV